MDREARQQMARSIVVVADLDAKEPEHRFRATASLLDPLSAPQLALFRRAVRTRYQARDARLLCGTSWKSRHAADGLQRCSTLRRRTGTASCSKLPVHRRRSPVILPKSTPIFTAAMQLCWTSSSRRARDRASPARRRKSRKSSLSNKAMRALTSDAGSTCLADRVNTGRAGRRPDARSPARLCGIAS